jgi:hypothetical protein
MCRLFAAAFKRSMLPLCQLRVAVPSVRFTVTLLHLLMRKQLL